MKNKILVFLIAAILSASAYAVDINTFLPIYTIVGNVVDQNGQPASGQQVIFTPSIADYNTTKSVTAQTNANGEFVLNATNPPIFMLNVGQNYKIGTLQNSSGYGVSPTDFSISGKGFEIIGQMKLALAGGFGPPTGGGQPPIITAIRFGNRIYMNLDGTVAKSKMTEIFGETDISWQQFFVDPNQDYLVFKQNIKNEIEAKILDVNKKNKLLDILKMSLDHAIGRKTIFTQLIEGKERFVSSANPKITVDLFGQGTTGINPNNKIKITATDQHGNVSEIKYASVIKSLSSAAAPNIIESVKAESTWAKDDKPLADNDNVVKIEALDESGAAVASESCSIYVAGGSIRVLDEPLTNPTPFNPSGGETLSIQYTLNNDANIDIYIISIAGETVKRMTFISGTEGGNAGRNKVTWDGRNQFGEIAGYGVYVATIVSKDQGKLLKKFKLSIAKRG